MNFDTFLTKATGEQPRPTTMLCFDPGETTGFAVFQRGLLTECAQLPTHTLEKGIPIIHELIQKFQPDCIIYELYRVYAWKTESHSWDTLHTPRLIGGIETLGILTQIPTRGQMAQQAKKFCTTDKLQMWGYDQPGKPHARDAIRHGCYYLLFNHKKYLEKPSKTS